MLLLLMEQHLEQHLQLTAHFNSVSMTFFSWRRQQHPNEDVRVGQKSADVPIAVWLPASTFQ